MTAVDRWKMKEAERICPGAVCSDEDIRTRLAAHQDAIRRLRVKHLALFGSFSRGEAHDTSDVDFLVEFEAGAKTFDAFMDLTFLLEELLGHPVELVTREALSQYTGPYLLEQAVDVYTAA